MLGNVYVRLIPFIAPLGTTLLTVIKLKNGTTTLFTLTTTVPCLRKGLATVNTLFVPFIVPVGVSPVIAQAVGGL